MNWRRKRRRQPHQNDSWKQGFSFSFPEREIRPFPSVTPISNENPFWFARLFSSHHHHIAAACARARRRRHRCLLLSLYRRDRQRGVGLERLAPPGAHAAVWHVTFGRLVSSNTIGRNIRSGKGSLPTRIFLLCCVAQEFSLCCTQSWFQQG